jgi:phosphoglycerate dehydrogenase-like enzyme
MTFKIVLLPPRFSEEWPEKIMEAIPGVDAKLFHDPKEALADIEDADAIYGTLPPELFSHAKKVRWMAAPLAGLGKDWFHKELVESDIVVTNTRNLYDDHISAHIMAFLLAFARRLDDYIYQQQKHVWQHLRPAMHLPECTALIVGVGGVGAETAKICNALGMRTIGIDPRLKEAPPGLDELHRPDALDSLMGEADFVILTTPVTPQTFELISAPQFNLMKPTAYFINIGRGDCSNLTDMTEAIASKKIAGAGLDVFQLEPLPSDHPLWDMPGVLITPHAAINGAAYLNERRLGILLENCLRFDRGEELMYIVDKANWF